MTTLTAVRVAEMPRVNLMPPEIAQAARFRQLQAMLALLVVAVLLGVGALYLMARGQVSSAAEELAAAENTNAALQAEVATYAEVPRVEAELAKAEADLEQAMKDEVRWSFYLNDLSLTIPSTVRLTSMNITEMPDIAPDTAATAGQVASGVVSPLGTPGIATITFEGRATSYDAVAAWLQMLARQYGYVDPTISQVSDATETDMVGQVFQFSSSVTVTEEATSGRYVETGGE
jgi:Tfp pilus assembly protein PilN